MIKDASDISISCSVSFPQTRRPLLTKVLPIKRINIIVNNFQWLVPGILIPLFLMGSCTIHEEKEKLNNVSAVRNALGNEKNIFQAKIKLERKGFNVSKPHDPTELGKKLWMRVDFEDSSTFLDGVLYAAEVPHKTISSSVLIESNEHGTITSIR